MPQIRHPLVQQLNIGKTTANLVPRWAQQYGLILGTLKINSDYHSQISVIKNPPRKAPFR